MSEPKWMRAAECRNHDPAWWAIETTDDDGRNVRALTEQNLTAEGLCRTVCPVRARCLAWKRQRETVDRWTWPLAIIGGVRHDARGREIEPAAPPAADEPLTLTQAARRAHMSETSIRRAIVEGLLPAQRRGGCWRLSPADVDALAERDQPRQVAA